LSYPLCLPDEIPADALRLLDVSREVINLTVTALWDRLDEFATRTNTHAYRQVEEMLAPPIAHGHRQWRCEAEQVGRILRGQAERKQRVALILPLLSHTMSHHAVVVCRPAARRLRRGSGELFCNCMT
jgi:putative transposase